MKLPSIKFNFLTLFLVAGIVTLLLLTVNCSISQNEKNAELRTLNSELSAAVNEGTKLQIEIDRRSDYFSVEQYASEVLGMHKLENYQIQYIQYDVSGSAELLHSEEDENFFGQIAKAFSAIGDFFGN
ncbi:MAG: cell division protein FtsL [Clostridia bacterium]|nr:cell division protein FtsL [Clostridia bacterium]